MKTALPATLLDAPEAQVDPSAFPVVVEIVPGALQAGIPVQASVHLHQIPRASGPLFCWSYLTSGLKTFGQKDVIFTVAVAPGANPGRFPTDPLRFAQTLCEFSLQGRVVDAGDITTLGGPGFMGFKGMTYAPAQPLDGVPFEPGTLAVVPLSAEELEVLQVGGQTRVLSALGNAYRHYPFPSWIDRRRGSVISPQRTQGTILAQMAKVTAPGYVRKEGNTVLLRLRGDGVAKVAGALATVPPDAAFALTTEVDPVSDGCLIWEAGQSAPSAITPPDSRGERLSGCFVAFVPGQPEDAGQLFEDGFSLLLSSASTARLRAALSTGQPLTLPGGAGKMGFALEWVPMTYENPMGGPVLHATGGFHRYGPQGGPAPAPAGPVTVKQVVFLVTDAEMSRRVESAAFLGYMKALEAVAVTCLSPFAGGDGWELLLEVSIAPGAAAKYQLAWRGAGGTNAALQALHDGVVQVPTPVVQEGPIQFNLQFEIRMPPLQQLTFPLAQPVAPQAPAPPALVAQPAPAPSPGTGGHAKMVGIAITASVGLAILGVALAFALDLFEPAPAPRPSSHPASKPAPAQTSKKR